MFLLITAELERCLEGESQVMVPEAGHGMHGENASLLQPGCDGLPAATLARARTVRTRDRIRAAAYAEAVVIRQLQTPMAQLRLQDAVLFAQGQDDLGGCSGWNQPMKDATKWRWGPITPGREALCCQLTRGKRSSSWHSVPRCRTGDCSVRAGPRPGGRPDIARRSNVRSSSRMSLMCTATSDHRTGFFASLLRPAHD